MTSKLRELLNAPSVKNTFLIFVLKILGIGSSYIFAILVSKQFGAKGWGIFSLAVGIATFGLLFGKLGFDTALLKYAAINKESKNHGHLKGIFISALKFLTPTGIIVVGLVIVFSEYLSTKFSPHQNIQDYIILISISIIPHVFILIISEGLRGLGEVAKYVFLQNIAIYLLASLVIAIYTSVKTGSVYLFEIFIVYDIAVIVTFIIALYWWIPMFLRTTINTEGVSVRNIFNTSFPMFWSNAMFVIIYWTDTLMLGIYSTDVEVGIYNAALKISNLVALPLFVITSISAPKFASAYAQDNLHALNTVVKRSTLHIFILTLPLFLIIMIFPQFFMEMFGSDFKSGVLVLMILISGQFLKTLCGSTDFLLQMTGHEKIFQYIILISMTINVGLNIWLIPLWGSKGAALSNALTMISWNIIAVYFIKEKLDINSLINFQYLKSEFSKIRMR